MISSCVNIFLNNIAQNTHTIVCSFGKQHNACVIDNSRLIWLNSFFFKYIYIEIVHNNINLLIQILHPDTEEQKARQRASENVVSFYVHFVLFWFL